MRYLCAVHPSQAHAGSGGEEERGTQKKSHVASPSQGVRQDCLDPLQLGDEVDMRSNTPAKKLEGAGDAQAMMQCICDALR